MQLVLPKLGKVYKKDDDVESMIFCSKMRIFRNHTLYSQKFRIK